MLLKAEVLEMRRFSLLFLAIGLKMCVSVIAELPLVLQDLSLTSFLCFSVMYLSHYAPVLPLRFHQCYTQIYTKELLINERKPNQEHPFTCTLTLSLYICAWLHGQQQKYKSMKFKWLAQLILWHECAFSAPKFSFYLQLRERSTVRGTLLQPERNVLQRFSKGSITFTLHLQK